LIWGDGISVLPPHCGRHRPSEEGERIHLGPRIGGGLLEGEGETDGDTERLGVTDGDTERLGETD
jgi:hypothetical protein